MSAAGRRSEDISGPAAVAAAIREADFVRLAATADGDALAATGLLVRALEATKTPAELEDNPEYDQLTSRIDDLRSELSDTLGGIEDDEDFIATIRELNDVENS